MEMKNICGKIPVELHEKLKLEVEELGISIPKYLEMVIEEHMTRKGEKTNMADLRTVAVQVTEDLFSRLKAVLAKNGMKQKDFLIGLIEEALKKEEAKWKAESAEATEPEEEPSETELEEAESAESETDEEPELKETETEEENGDEFDEMDREELKAYKAENEIDTFTVKKSMTDDEIRDNIREWKNSKLDDSEEEAETEEEEEETPAPKKTGLSKLDQIRKKLGK
jgi:ribosomal protein L16 Arg81 hydroxylase